MTMTHALPVTVAVARRTDPARTSEMVAWMRAGTALAEAFPGFLGSGWVRSAPGSGEWHVIYRFADHETLRRWEESPQRHWWLSSAQGIVEHTRVERRTGVEGLVRPAAGARRADRAGQRRADGAAAGPTALEAGGDHLAGVLPAQPDRDAAHQPVSPGPAAGRRVLMMTLTLTPLMTYLVLPRITRALHWWLHGQRAPWRLAR